MGGPGRRCQAAPKRRSERGDGAQAAAGTVERSCRTDNHSQGKPGKLPHISPPLLLLFSSSISSKRLRAPSELRARSAFLRTKLCSVAGGVCRSFRAPGSSEGLLKCALMNLLTSSFLSALCPWFFLSFLLKAVRTPERRPCCSLVC